MSNPIEKLTPIFQPPGSSSAVAPENAFRQIPTGGADDIRRPIQNLSNVRDRMESLQQFLSGSVNANKLIGRHQMDMVSAEIASAIHQVIVNGAALLASAQQRPLIHQNPTNSIQIFDSDSKNSNSSSIFGDFDEKKVIEPKIEVIDNDSSSDYEIIELDAVELLAEHIHFCDICGKGFKRDANLRMHMRAHGNQFKTLEALAKPEKGSEIVRGRTRFSCPYLGCNRNKLHKKFKPLKSAICVKNHFKRSHCPKMYSCNRCNKKTFSVLADLKSHLKHCGETRWKCSCGTSFSRKDKLFGHMALFEGHMPAVDEEVEKAKEVAAAVAVDEEDEEAEVEVEEEEKGVKEMEISNSLDNWLLEGLLDEFSSIENFCFQDVLGDGFSFL